MLNPKATNFNPEATKDNGSCIIPIDKEEEEEEDGEVPPVIGDFRDGGVVFWIDPNDNTKGLVVDVKDLSTSAEWGCYEKTIIGADGTAICTGAQNTLDILATCTTVGTAADICANLTLNTYSDWFLPSIDALTEIYNNRVAINTTDRLNGGAQFSDGDYWSSTESSSNYAWLSSFCFGYSAYNDKDVACRVRAVRAF